MQQSLPSRAAHQILTSRGRIKLRDCEQAACEAFWLRQRHEVPAGQDISFDAEAFTRQALL
jgi:hypothetical protein